MDAKPVIWMSKEMFDQSKMPVAKDPSSEQQKLDFEQSDISKIKLEDQYGSSHNSLEQGQPVYGDEEARSQHTEQQVKEVQAMDEEVKCEEQSNHQNPLTRKLTNIAGQSRDGYTVALEEVLKR